MWIFLAIVAFAFLAAITNDFGKGIPSFDDEPGHREPEPYGY
jgi:hypothetical protein